MELKEGRLYLIRDSGFFLYIGRYFSNERNYDIPFFRLPGSGAIIRKSGVITIMDVLNQEETEDQLNRKTLPLWDEDEDGYIPAIACSPLAAKETITQLQDAFTEFKTLAVGECQAEKPRRTTSLRDAFGNLYQTFDDWKQRRQLPVFKEV